MNRIISKGKWKEFKGKVQEQWGDLTEDELNKSEGKLEQLKGNIRQKYGESVEDISEKLNQLYDSVEEKTKSRDKQ